MKVANRAFENVAKFRYFGMIVANQNSVHEEIKRRLNLGNACYHSAQNLLSSCLLSKYNIFPFNKYVIVMILMVF
jgi:hypothetical protein